MSTFSHEGPRQAVLVYVTSKTQVLLARKKRSFAVGRWNGYGGMLEPGETALEGALRELKEEAGIDRSADQLVKVAQIDAQNYLDQEGREISFSMRITVFLAPLLSPLHVQIQETAEMKEPRWFWHERLPKDQMIASDKDWLPLVLRGEKIYAAVYNGPDQKTIVQPTQIYSLESAAARCV